MGVFFLLYSTSSADSQQSSSTSETPVQRLRLRSTRSRTAQSTSSRVTRNSRAASKKTEEKGNAVPESKGSQDKVVKITLPSVSEAVNSPRPTASVSNSTTSGSDESEKSDVLQRARAYENMLSGRRNHGSPVTPKSASKELASSAGEGTPKSADKESQPGSAETEPAASRPDSVDMDVVDASRSSQRRSEINRRSSAAGKGTSLKVLGSKARLRSLQGHLSVTASRASLTRMAAQEINNASQEELVAELGGKPAEQTDEEVSVSQVFAHGSSTPLFIRLPMFTHGNSARIYF